MLILLIKAYQLCLSPFLGKRCRFYPSCSEYGITALKTYGLLKGCWLTFKRISRCRPGNPGGVDHLPSL